jgi:hypothetical protein
VYPGHCRQQVGDVGWLQLLNVLAGDVPPVTGEATVLEIRVHRAERSAPPSHHLKRGEQDDVYLHPDLDPEEVVLVEVERRRQRFVISDPVSPELDAAPVPNHELEGAELVRVLDFQASVGDAEHGKAHSLDRSFGLVLDYPPLDPNRLSSRG